MVNICIQICVHTLLWGRYLDVKFLACLVLFHTNSLAIYIYISNLCPMEGYKMNETYSFLGEISDPERGILEVGEIGFSRESGRFS